MLEHLPERDAPAAKRRLRRASAREDDRQPLGQFQPLASEL